MRDLSGARRQVIQLVVRGTAEPHITLLIERVLGNKRPRRVVWKRNNISSLLVDASNCVTEKGCEVDIAISCLYTNDRGPNLFEEC